VKGWLRGRNNLTAAVNQYDTPAPQTASTSGASPHVQIATREFLVSDEHSAESYSSADDNGNDEGEYTPYTSDDEHADVEVPVPRRTDTLLPPEQASTSSGVLDSPASPPYHERLSRAPWTTTRNYRNRMFPPLSHFVTTRASTNAGFATLQRSSGSSNRVAGHSSVSQSPIGTSSQHMALYHAPDPRPGRQTVASVVASDPSRQSTTHVVSAQNTDARSSFRESEEEYSNS